MPRRMRASDLRTHRIPKGLRKTVHRLMKNDAQRPRCNLVGLDDCIRGRKLMHFGQIFWLILFIISSCSLVYQTYDRVVYYLSRPIAVDVKTESSDIVLPAFMICGGNTKAMNKLWNENKPENDFLKLKCTNIFRNLLAKPVDMTELWKATNVTKEIINITLKGFTNDSFVQSEIGSLTGICPTFQFHKAPIKSFIGNSLSVVLSRFYETDCTVDYQFSISSNKEFGNFITMGAQLGRMTRVNIEFKKYKYLNSTKNPCSSEDEYKDCYRKCLSKKLTDTLSCKFPFINVETSLPPCDCSNSTYEQYPIAFTEIGSIDPVSECLCKRPCQQINFIPYRDSEVAQNDKTFVVTLAITEDKIQVYEEWYTYDIIALLSDIGGNLGFFLGLSLISLIETSYYFFYLSTSSPKSFSANRNRVSFLYEKCMKKDNLQRKKSKEKGLLLKLKIMIFVISTGFSVFLLQNRLTFYFEEPTTRLITIEKRQNNQFPTVTVCGETANFRLEKRRLEISKSTGEICGDISPWRLVYTRLSLTSLWDSLNIHEKIVIETDFAKFLTGSHSKLNITKNNIPLSLGNCSQVHISASDNLNSYFLVQMVQPLPPKKCPFNRLWYFLNNPDELVNIMSPMVVMYRHYNIVKLRMLKIVRKHSKRKPCEPSIEEHFKCKNICLQHNPLEMINCSLPFMFHHQLHPCVTWETVEESRTRYLKNYEKNQRKCKCNNPCEETYYQVAIFVNEMPMDYVTMIEHKFSDDKVETIEEKEAYPKAKCISDVGSIIGLALGVSVLSIYDYILKTIDWFSFNKIKKI